MVSISPQPLYCWSYRTRSDTPEYVGLFLLFKKAEHQTAILKPLTFITQVSVFMTHILLRLLTVKISAM